MAFVECAWDHAMQDIGQMLAWLNRVGTARPYSFIRIAHNKQEMGNGGQQEQGTCKTLLRIGNKYEYYFSRTFEFW